MGISKNSDTLKSSILIGFSIINHSFWGTPIFGNTHVVVIVFHISGQIRSRPHTTWDPKWWFSKGNPPISGKSRLVKY